MGESKFYDGTKLLSMLDLDGNRPEIYICTSNRAGGKTTYFNRLLMNRFFKKGEKFILIYRLVGELKDVEVKFFNDIQSLFFPEYYMYSGKLANGKVVELFVNDVAELDKPPKERKEGKSCGYAVCLKDSSKLKLYSHLMTDATTMVFDEFQPEDNRYLPNELNHFVSLHTSLARGHGQQSRYLPVIMISNAVTLLNPYYSNWHIGERLQKDTKFLRGHGWVMECAYVESAAKSMKGSAFNRAFAGNRYLTYATENIYLNDNEAFIERPKGRSRYVATLKYDGREYGILNFYDDNMIYISDRANHTAGVTIVVRPDDMDKGFQLLGMNSFLIDMCRRQFNAGMVRFKNQSCKAAFMQMVRY